MTTAYTSLLGLALPVTGELSGTWGDTVNNSITSLLDSAVAGTTTLSTDLDVTLTTTTGAANTAREAILLCSGARTALRTITAPAQSKIYTIINATTGGYSVKLVGSGPTTGLTIPNGASAVVAWNGSDFIEIGSASVGNFTVNGNLTVTGTSTLTGAITNTAGTANGVAYLNGSKVLTTGTALTFNGTVLTASASAATTGNFKATSSTAQVLNVTASNDADTTVGLLVLGSAAGSIGMLGAGSPALYTAATELNLMANNASGVIKFAAGGSSEQMRLTSTGLGIGTSSPYSKLSVEGDINLHKNANNTIVSYTGAAYTNLQYDAATHKFFVSGSTAATIDSAGNLGLGVTPSAWNTSYKAQEIGAVGNGLIGFGANDFAMSSGAYYSSTGWKYSAANSLGASFYEQYTGQHIWYNKSAVSHSAGDPITFTQAMTLDASGNLIVGDTTSLGKLSVWSAANNDILAGFRCKGTGTQRALYISGDNSTGIVSLDVTGSAPGSLAIKTGGTTTALFDTSGNLLVGTTSPNTITNTNGFSLNAGNGFIVQNHVSGSVTGTTYTYFGYDTSVIGSIVQAGTTGVLYNVTSDYRLKDIAGPVTNSGAFIDKLNPVQGSWKADGSRFIGFLAHELQEASETVVGTGVKDGEEMQSIDYSNAELIANMAAELKSLRKRLAALEAK